MKVCVRGVLCKSAYRIRKWYGMGTLGTMHRKQARNLLNFLGEFLWSGGPFSGPCCCCCVVLKADQ